MAQRPRIDKESIVLAALALLREGGWAAVSAREIAARLGSSTMPIYSVMGSMERLRAECDKAARALFEAAIRRPCTGKEALDLAAGYVAFARDEPRLFGFVLAGIATQPSFVIDIQGDTDGNPAIPRQLDLIMRRLMDLGHCHDSATRSLIFAHGLACLSSSGVIDVDDAEIIRQLQAAGAAFRKAPRA